jgi:hypothetical protein
MLEPGDLFGMVSGTHLPWATSELPSTPEPIAGRKPFTPGRWDARTKAGNQRGSGLQVAVVTGRRCSGSPPRAWAR